MEKAKWKIENEPPLPRTIPTCKKIPFILPIPSILSHSVNPES
jgi:hypothetical protein